MAHVGGHVTLRDPSIAKSWKAGLSPQFRKGRVQSSPVFPGNEFLEWIPDCSTVAALAFTISTTKLPPCK